MRKFGLIGYPLSHSFSPKYFKGKFESEAIIDAQYDIYEIKDAEEVLMLFEGDLLGVNVTIPHKEAVIPFLDDLHDTASSVMAVNTIKKVDNRLIGYNTDLYGFEHSIDSKWWSKNKGKALILGTGGASKAVATNF